MRRSFAPVLASIEYDRDRWRTGEPVRCGVWSINDGWDSVPEASIHWRILDNRGAVRDSGEWPANIPPDSAQKLGYAVWTAGQPGSYELRAEVRSRDQLISENVFEFEVTQ